MRERKSCGIIETASEKGLIKMKKSIFNKDGITPACRLCAHGVISADGESVLCVKTGVRLLDSSCKSFKYDPLKRVPRRCPDSFGFTEEDFRLD